MARILLVEPDRLLAQIYQDALRAAGHKVVVAATAQTAIQAADKHRVDVVILELQLVEHSGIEFLYEFRSYPDWQHVPVLLHTQVPPMEFNSSQRLLTEELGVSKYLYKPRTSLRELLRSVHEFSPQPA